MCLLVLVRVHFCHGGHCHIWQELMRDGRPHVDSQGFHGREGALTRNVTLTASELWVEWVEASACGNHPCTHVGCVLISNEPCWKWLRCGS